MRYFLMLTMLGVLGGAFFTFSMVDARESLNPISVDAIRLLPESYDGKSLKVSGQVRSLTQARGKMDSEFIVLVLEGSKTRSEAPSQVVNVFSYFVPPLKKGNRVIVTGTYHKTGYWAGVPRDHFIIATEITPLLLN